MKSAHTCRYICELTPRWSEQYICYCRRSSFQTSHPYTLNFADSQTGQSLIALLNIIVHFSERQGKDKNYSWNNKEFSREISETFFNHRNQGNRFDLLDESKTSSPWFLVTNKQGQNKIKRKLLGQIILPWQALCDVSPPPLTPNAGKALPQRLWGQWGVLTTPHSPLTDPSLGFFW